MSRKWYGSIDNRIEEGRNYEPDKIIKVGTDITTYFWSDRHCKYVTEVIDQKHIFVKDYYVVADRASGSYSNQWKYFKSLREQEAYLNDWYRSHPEDAAEYERIMGKPYEYANLDEIKESSREEEWVFRYGHWNRVRRYDSDSYNRCLERTKRESKDGQPIPSLARYYLGLTDEEFAKLQEKGKLVKYHRISEGISFGVRDYYYDYEF